MVSHVNIFNLTNQGATLNSFNSELVKSLEGLKERRENILMEIKKEDERKNELEKIIFKLKEELEQVNGNNEL